MYKLLICTREVTRREESPFRKVVELPFREAEFQDTSPLLKDPQTVHLFKSRTTNSKEHFQQPNITLQTGVEVKTQIVFVINISRDQQKDIFHHLQQRIDHVQLIETVASEEQSHHSTSIVVYFANIAISEEFYNLISESYHQLAFYVKNVTILKSQQILKLINEQTLSLTKTTFESEQISIYKQNWIQIPRCLTCLEKLQYDLTGLSARLFANKTISESNSCKACLILIQKAKGQSSTSCEQCGSAEDNWICMVCDRVGCGRYKNADAFKHFQKTGHIYSMDLETQRVWNYLSDSFCHRIIPLLKQEVTLKFPDSSSYKKDTMAEESLEGAFWQYCSVVSEELERQRAFYEKMKIEERQRYDRQSVKIDKSISEIQSELLQKAQIIKKMAKKNRKMEKRTVQLKEKIRDDRELMGQYEIRIRQETASPTIAELDKSHPKIQEKLHILDSLQSEIDSILVKLSE